MVERKFSEDALFEGRRLACQRGERLLFQDLDFVLRTGQALILEGANGSGKSSLLRLAAGLARPAFGGLFWGGAPIGKDAEAHRRRLLYLGHADGLKAGLTVYENLDFWARLTGVTTPLDDALDSFDMAPLADLPARFLSAGQRRRLALTRLSLRPAQPPVLWLLDEPTTALDAAAQATLLALIRRHLVEGGLAMLASHDPLPGLDAQRLRIEDDHAEAAV